MRTVRSGRPIAASVLAAILVLATSCAPSADDLVSATCSSTLLTTATGTVTDASLPEVSGVAASTTHPGVLWVHNDSGDSARVFALRADGTRLATFDVSGATAVDWEDIALGPGATAGQRALYVGDIGDNALARASVAVYRFPEPAVDPAAAPIGTVTITGAEKLTLTYPAGARNAEALLVDTDGAIYIVTKQSGSGTIYRAPAGLAGGSTTMLQDVGTVTLSNGDLFTGGDIAPSGDAILLRTYFQVRMFQRTVGTTVPATLTGGSCAGALVFEPQGEAIGFTADARAYVTLSEGANQPINRYAVP